MNVSTYSRFAGVGSIDPVTGLDTSQINVTPAPISSVANLQMTNDVADLPLNTLTPDQLQQLSPTVLDESLPCIPQGAFGPLQPGQAYCAPGQSPSSPSSNCPAGSTCTIVNGVPNTAIYVLVGAVLSFFVISAVNK